MVSNRDLQVMMSHTPATPIRGIYGNEGFGNVADDPVANSSNDYRKLPLIVDIALDNNGKQLYQVHESSKLVRNEMPRSTNFGNHDHPELLSYEERTPIRQVLGTISPSTLNQKKLLEDEYDEPKEYGEFPGGYDSQPSLATSTMSVSSFSRVQDNDIWSEDVEQAFEEVLSIIPKNGLNKIKISGRLCGRNELISDYIFTKTGKFRTRKQVSSHIQVIKNLGQKLDIIKLISDGPTFPTEDEQIRNTKRFEDIFSKINLNKSLGFDGVNMGNTPETKRRNSIPGASSKRSRRAPHLNISHTPFTTARFENFFMSVCDSYSQNPIILSIQNNTDEIKSLKIREGANIAHRFPGLNDLHNMPIIHNMVKVLFPTTLPYQYSWETGFKSNFMLSEEDAGAREYSSFTCIYSFGKEVLKFNEAGFQLGQNREFLLKFWKFFLLTLTGKDEAEVSMAFKGMTIKQIVYESDTGDSDDSESEESTEIHLMKLKIRMVLLWEFANVLDFKEAITTTTKLILSTRIDSEENVLPQVLEWDGGERLDSTPYEGNPSTGSSTLGTLNSMPPSVPIPVSAFEPQMNVQRKFLNLQGSSQIPQIQPIQQMQQQPLHPQQLQQQAQLHAQQQLQAQQPLQGQQFQRPFQPQQQFQQVPMNQYSQMYSPQQRPLMQVPQPNNSVNVDLMMTGEPEYPMMYPDLYQFN